MVRFSARTVSPRAVQREAEGLYRQGFFCCEAVMSALRDAFQIDVPEEVIAMSSGMAVGMGRSGCVCGALNGGALALGLFFGRTTPGGPDDPRVVRCMALSHELHDWFRAATAKRSCCCRALTRGFDMGSGEHREQCVAFTGLAAGKTAEMLCRELEVENLDEEPVSGLERPFLPGGAAVGTPAQAIANAAAIAVAATTRPGRPGRPLFLKSIATDPF